MTSQQIRQQFLDFFAAKGHVFAPSSPVVPHDDPTLMFTNAGMNQFKPIFLGTARAEHPRVVNSQKCIRAGGKHNDLDDVGQDTYHHTFFEMLGNWSFGDYFKKEAIEWAWELLTKVWGIDKSRLHATYFGGKPEVQSSKFKVHGVQSTSDFEPRTSDFELEPDNEARELWTSVTDIDPSHVHPGSMKDNFWEMGDTGPCGPCSEIHIDLTPDKSGRDLVNKGDARMIELWNLVFIQFNRASDGKLTPLPAKHVDTGMGFERLCAVLQKKTSNYDTDVFTPIFEAIRKRTGAPEYRGTLPVGSAVRTDTSREADELPIANFQLPIEAGRVTSQIDNRQSSILVDVSYRVIADHLRCLVFALTDGAIPSNEGRGYVLRRILRRAVRYARQYMNVHEPFLCDLVQTVVEHIAGVFPELRTAHGGKNVQHVSDLIREEEASFIKTLDRGITLFYDAKVRAINRFCDPPDPLVRGRIYDYARSSTYQPFAGTPVFNAGALDWTGFPGPERPIIAGEDAFKLHDTYGFPIDLTQLMAEEQGLTVDISEYERLMEEARDRARCAVSHFSDLAESFRSLPPELTREFGKTDDSFKYDDKDVEANQLSQLVQGFPPGTFKQCDEGGLMEGSTAAIVLDGTPFYAEQGGQVCDTGAITTNSGEFRVDVTQRLGELILHIGQVTRGQLLPTERYRARVNWPRRRAIEGNHTATHILNWALREVLGKHVQQKGSLVDPEKTRFDFSHHKQLGEDELAKIEQHVRSQISNALPVFTSPNVDQKKAREVNTLRAVFGEKYPDKVRVVSIGADIDAMLRDPTNLKWMQYSVEFCGGTHLKNSKEAEEFVLVSEEGVAKGVRRVVGVTAEKAREAVRRGEQFLEIAEALRKGSPLPPPSPQPSPLKGEGATGPRSGRYDLARLLKEIAEAQIPILTRHQLAGQIAVLQEAAKEQQKKSTAQAQRGAVEAVGDLLASKAVDVAGVTVLVAEVPGGNADALRSGIDYVRNKKGSSGVLLVTVDDGKVTLVAGMSKDLVARGIRAGDLIKEICPLVGGKGGGRPDMAQGGGTDPKGLPQALERATEWLANKLSA